MTGNERTANPPYQFVRINMTLQQALRSPSQGKLLDLNQANYPVVEPVSYNQITTWTPDGRDGPLSWLYARLGSYFSNAFFFHPFRHSTDSLNVIGKETIEQDGSILEQVLHTLTRHNQKLLIGIESCQLPAHLHIG